MSPDRSPAVATVLLLFAAALFPPVAGGDETRVVPSLALKGEYNNNPFFTEKNPKESYVGTVSPGLKLSRRTERLDAVLSSVVDGVYYSAEENLDSWNPRGQGKLGYRFTPAFRLSADASLRADKRPEHEIETSGLVVTTRTRQQDYALGAEISMSEKSAAGLSYGYNRVDYPDQPLQDSETHSGSVNLVVDLGQRFTETKGRAGFSYASNRFTGLTVENYAFTVGVQKGATELWSVQADIGGRYTRSEFDFLFGKEKTDNWGWVANVSLFYKGERGNGSLGYGRSVTAASGRGGAAERNAVVLDLARRFLYELSGTFSAGYYRNFSDAGEFSLQGIDEQTVRARPGLRYDFTKDISVEAAYQYTRLRNRISSETAEQHAGTLRFAVRYPLYE
ncbi:MAG: hypothetical protein A2Z13_08265 [Deltaproteobacteria bacterium RBG_16_64_85]|nr:MAG: hypothetical protein A2Z13_08265 [Deltaproteobacteria bacterium RBG_16_64_85]